MRIGLFGGSFDPVHKGHVAIAEAACSQLQLNEVVWVPASRNPLKHGTQANSRQRLEMVQIAIRNHPEFSVTDLEILRGGKSYTHETLMDFAAIKPGEYWLILGSDSLKQFDTWRNWQKIVRLARLAVVVRPGQNRADLQESLDDALLEKVDWIEMPPLEVSSTEIRYRLQAGKPMPDWLHSDVVNYIRANNLYKLK